MRLNCTHKKRIKQHLLRKNQAATRAAAQRSAAHAPQRNREKRLTAAVLPRKTMPGSKASYREKRSKWQVYTAKTIGPRHAADGPLFH
jgi:hypothetical protein